LVTVPFADADAEETAYRVWDKQEELVENDKEIGGIAKRAFEQTMKFATIRAVSRDFVAPAVTVQDVEFGEAIAWTSIRMLRDGLRRYMSGSDFEANWKLLLQHVDEAGDGGLTKWQLTRRSGVGKIKQKDLDDTTKYLTETGRWRAVKENRGVRYFSVGGMIPEEAPEEA
jgi:hypothetical protein